jgi:Tetratricopeptide repeat
MAGARDRQREPEDWAGGQLTLGNSYAARIRGERVENRKAAIVAYQATLTVYTSDAFTQDWAQTQNNLGIAYAERIRGERAVNLETAIAAYQDALTILTRGAYPVGWR